MGRKKRVRIRHGEQRRVQEEAEEERAGSSRDKRIMK